MSEDEIAVMDGGKCIMRLRGVRPFFSDKFDITKHRQYKELSDYDPYITNEERAKFEGLWQEWLDMKLYLMAKGTPLMEKGYNGVFESLPEEKKSKLIGRKSDFAKMAGIYL